MIGKAGQAKPDDNGVELSDSTEFEEQRRRSALISHEKRMQILSEAMFGPVSSQFSRLVESGKLDEAEKLLDMYRRHSREEIDSLSHQSTAQKQTTKNKTKLGG